MHTKILTVVQMASHTEYFTPTPIPIGHFARVSVRTWRHLAAILGLSLGLSTRVFSYQKTLYSDYSIR